MGWCVFFLENELQAVGERLAESPKANVRERYADAVWPDAVLRPGLHPPLQEHEIRGGGHEAAGEESDFDEGFEHVRNEVQESAIWFSLRSMPTSGTPCIAAEK